MGTVKGQITVGGGEETLHKFWFKVELNSRNCKEDVIGVGGGVTEVGNWRENILGAGCRTE